MRITRLLTCLALSVAAVSWLLAEDRAAIKIVPLKQTSPASGKEMFRAYCAVCHGMDGTGNGPAAAYLTIRPADLTRLAAVNSGKYPDLQVLQRLASKEAGHHENVGMPAWGGLLGSLNRWDPDIARHRAVNLTAFIKTIQE